MAKDQNRPGIGMSLPQVTLVLCDIAALLASLWLGYQIRFDFTIPDETRQTFPLIFPWVIGFQVFCLWRFRRFEVLLGYFTIPEASRLFWALFVPSLFIFGVSTQLGSNYGPPRSVVLTDFGFAVIALTAIRLAFRPDESRQSQGNGKCPPKRARRAGIDSTTGGRRAAGPVRTGRRIQTDNTDFPRIYGASGSIRMRMTPGICRARANSSTVWPAGPAP